MQHNAFTPDELRALVVEVQHLALTFLVEHNSSGAGMMKPSLCQGEMLLHIKYTPTYIHTITYAMTCMYVYIYIYSCNTICVWFGHADRLV